MINKVTLGGNAVPGIIRDTFHYHAQSGASGAFRLGGVFGSYIEFDYFTPSAVTLTVGDLISYYQTVDVDRNFDPITPSRDIFINSFVVKEIAQGNKRAHVIAYDDAVKLDVDFSQLLKSLEPQFPMTVYDLLNQAANYAGVNTNMLNAIPVYVSMLATVEYFYADGITARDIFGYISELYGGNCYCSSPGYIFASNYDITEPADTWRNSNEYIISPDSEDYSNLTYYKYNAWYKENGLERGVQPVAYDGVRIVSSSGVTLGEYYANNDPQKIYYITGNLIVDNISSFGGSYTFDDFASEFYTLLNDTFNTRNFVPTKATLFPFRFPYFVGRIATSVDVNGVKAPFPIQSLDLTGSDVVIEGFGGVDEEYGYGSNYTTADKNITLSQSQLNTLFNAVNTINSNEKYKVFNSVEDIGLTIGSATITDAFNALPTDSILITNEAEYASASRPVTGWEGQIIICKGANLWRSYVEAKGNTASYGDYRMYLSSGTPTGTWLFQGAEGVVLWDDADGATSGTLAEAVGNFNRVKVTWGPSDRGYLLTQEAYTHKASSFQIPLGYSTETTQNGNVFMSVVRIKLNGTTMTTDRNYNITIAANSITSTAWSGRIFRVEGYYI